MSYVITTRLVTRRMVSTLDEARLAVANIYDGDIYSAVEDARDNCYQADMLVADGGIIGPFPDGTTITVERI